MSNLDVTSHYQSEHARFTGEVAGAGVIGELRQAAFGRFNASGFPAQGRASEQWKYTNLTPLAGTPFVCATYGETKLTRADITAKYGLDFSLPTAVLINGFYSAELSNPAGAGVEIMSLAEAAEQRPDLLKKYLGQVASETDNAFINLNTAFMGAGALVVAGGGASADEAVQVVSITDCDKALATAPRLLYVAEEGAEAALLEAFISEGSVAQLTNSVTEIVLVKGAKLSHYRAQLDSEAAYQINHTRIQQAEGSDYNGVSLARGSALGRFDVHVGLYGERANCDLFGLYLTKGAEHQGSEISTTHAVPHCTSKQYFKGILSGKSRAVFSGKVKVEEGAIKTDAEQKDLNLLLSRGAEIDTKPSLEIYADDVICGHGATAGHLDETTLFYLRSRGLSLSEAMRLQTLGFASEVIDRAENEQVAGFYERVIGDELPKLLAESDLLA